MKYLPKTIAALLAFTSITAPAIAQEAGPPDGWTLGAIGAVSTNPYIGEGTQVLPYPVLTYRKGPLSIGTLGLEYRLYDTDRLSFSAGITPRFSGLFNTDAPELDGIDREITGDLALQFDYEFAQGFDAGLTFRQEITGEHDGQELIFDLGYGTQLGRVSLDLSAGAAWQSEDLSGYIWGVSPSEARTGRSAYAPGDVFIPFVSINAFMPLTEKWTLVGGVRADFLPTEVSDSPIVDQDDILTATFGVTYSF